MRLVRSDRVEKELRRDKSARMALGKLAHQVAAMANGCFSVNALLNEHSAAPLVGSLLDPEVESILFIGLRSDAPQENLVNQLSNGAIVAKCIRRCPICVKEDEANYGVAFWRVAHQLLPIHYCSAHNVMLEEMCGKCGTPYSVRSNPSRTFLARCPSCGCATGMAPLDWSKKQPAAYQPFVSLVERALRGEAQELRPLNRLAIIATAVNSFNGSIGNFIDLFCKWWGVDQPEDLCSWFGASLTQDVLRKILMGQRWVDPKLVVIGVTSFAQEWLRQRNADVQEPLRFSVAPCAGESGVHMSIESELAERARAAGIPAWHALQIAAGKAFSASWLHSAEGFVLQRFIDSLPQEHRETVAKRHALARAWRRHSSASVAERQALVTYLRNAVLVALNSEPKNYFRRNNPKLTIWFNRHDRSWLQTQLDDRGFRPGIWKSLEAAREEFSSNLEALLARCPTAGIMELNNQNVKLRNLLDRHDSVWFEEKIEAFRRTTYLNRLFESVLRQRTKFLAAVHDTLLSPTEVNLRARPAQIWLRRYDRVWLEEQMLEIKVRKLELKIREKRVAVAVYIEQGCRSRGDLARAHKVLHDWMKKNDRTWLDVQLPDTKTYIPR